MKNKEINQLNLKLDKKEIKKEKKVRKLSKRTLKLIKLGLYVTMLIMIYVLSPRLTELLKQGLQAIINTPSENITRIITIILAVIFSIFVSTKRNKKGE